ncbi:hypothetical protein SAMN04487761_10465 [Lachnospiraceae bacterium C7]|nr:hypothetical protein SAMN04487761_10465 [Lachnospiraceae bacterium C7]
MEEKIEQAFLYDFYGELLNEHQRQVYEDFVFNDLSLGEIAEERDITRQGVSDMIKRCTKKLEGFESKLHLIRKFMSIKLEVEEIHALVKELKSNPKTEIIDKIETISNQIIEEL